MKRQHISASIPVELAEQFRARAEAEERSISAQLRWALREHLNLNNGEAPATTPGPRKVAAERGHDENSG